MADEAPYPFENFPFQSQCLKLQNDLPLVSKVFVFLCHEY